MATQIEICNLALDMVGAEPIVLITDDNVRAQALNRNYTLALREVLRARDWGFAVARVSLDATTAPAFGWDFAFTLPADFITITQLNGILYEGEPGDWFALEGGLLLTNSEFADIVYISSTFAEATFDALFVPAFATLLASRIATPLRQDGGTAMMNLLALYRDALARAAVKNANERKLPYTSPASDSTFVRSRWFQRR